MLATGIGVLPMAARAFPANLATLAESREFIRATLSEWERDELAEVAALLAGELVTNVVMHANTELAVRLTWDDANLKVAIEDGSPAVPAIRDLSTEPGGYGLRIIDELATAWGVERTDTGKAVWFTLMAV